MSTTKKDSKKLQLQLERLSKKVITESEILAIKRCINPSSTLPKRMKNALDEIACNLEIDITPEQTKKGIDYLRKSMFKKGGVLRDLKNWPEDLQSFEIEIVRDFKKFTFCGFYNISENYYDHFVPVYKVISKSGSWFTYTGVRFDEIQTINKHYEINPVK